MLDYYRVRRFRHHSAALSAALCLALLFVSPATNGQPQSVEVTLPTAAYTVTRETSSLASLSVPVDQQPHWQDTALAIALADAVGGQLGTVELTTECSPEDPGCETQTVDIGPVFIYATGSAGSISGYVYVPAASIVETVELVNEASLTTLGLPVAIVAEVPPDLEVTPEPEGPAAGLSPEELAVVTLLLNRPLAEDMDGSGGLPPLPGGECVEGQAYEPIVRVNPAVGSRIGGYCEVGYTVTTNGATRDAQAVDCSPEGLFEEASLRAIEDFRYAPCLVDGVPREVADVRTRFEFSGRRRK